MEEVKSTISTALPDVSKKYSILEFFTIFSALAIASGFTFFAGFCRQLDGRLLQFMTAQDFVSVTSYYILGGLLALLAYSQFSYSDYNPDHYASRGLIQWLSTDYALMTPEQGERHIRLSKIGIMLTLLPGVVMLTALASAFTYSFWSWHIIPVHMFVSLLIASALPAGIFTCLHAMVIERKATKRRAIALKGLMFLGLIGMFGYGSFEGAMIADQTGKDIEIQLTDKSAATGIFVYRFAAGLAYRRNGDKSIYFLPNDKISSIRFLSPD
jgi:hypothetical protein